MNTVYGLLLFVALAVLVECRPQDVNFSEGAEGPDDVNRQGFGRPPFRPNGQGGRPPFRPNGQEGRPFGPNNGQGGRRPLGPNNGQGGRQAQPPTPNTSFQTQPFQPNQPTQPTNPASTNVATTRIPPRDPTNRIVYLVSCNCPFTYQYSPICGTDGQTYGNMGVLQCAKQCGTQVDVYLAGACGSNNG